MKCKLGKTGTYVENQFYAYLTSCDTDYIGCDTSFTSSGTMN